MLNSITTEKQNRILEVLMTSVSSGQLLAGKIIALGLAGLLQTLVWSGLGITLLRISGKTFDIPSSFQLPISIIAWGVVYFLLGYALYASLMAGVGALVPNIREASQMTFIVMVPLIVPMMMITALVQSPNGVISVFLSFFPLTSPVAMMTRMAATQLPVWQPLLAAVIVLGTAVLAVRSVSGMFRAQNLLSGQNFNIKIFIKALLGRA
jgi:ABC-2 type transport system permease protein